jgi:hypothetical protein
MAGPAAPEFPTMTLSDTQGLILGDASQHEQGLAAAPKTLPAAARNAVFRSMLKNGLLAECAAPREYAGLAWREDADGARVALRITDAGLRAIGVVPDARSAPEEHVLPAEAARDAPTAPDEAAEAEDLVRQDQAPVAPVPPRGANLRQAAQAVLDTWDDGADRGALAGPMERLRAALAKPARTARDPAVQRKPREGTKRERVLSLLRRPEGASGPQLIEATGWAPHTVRGFLAGLQRRGTAVTVLERVRQVGPNKDGAKGSYTVYRVAEAG